MITDSTKKAIENAREVLADVPNGMQTALMRSYNRALITGRKVASKAITNEYTLKARDAKGTFHMQKATRQKLFAELGSKGENLPLSKFAYKPKKDTTGSARKPVRVSVKKGTGFTKLGDAFVHQGRVFKRLGAPRSPMRKPLEMQFGPSVPGALKSDKARETVMEAMSDTVEKRLEHETQRLLDSHKTKG